MSIICGQFLIFHQIYYFCVFSWFLPVTVTYFCKIPKITCSVMQSVERQFILFPRSITISVWCKILWLEDVFLWCDFLNFGVSPNYSKYRELQWWGWHNFDFCQVNVFSEFFIIFQCYNHIFLPNFPNSYSKMRIVDNQFTLHSKSITVLVSIFCGWRMFFHNTVIFSIAVYCKLFKL